MIKHYSFGSESTVTVEQGSEVFTWTDCNDVNYINSMDVYWEEGMVPIFSLWGSEDTNDMWWMDDKTGCQPEGGVVGCDIDNAIVVFSDFSLE